MTEEERIKQLFSDLFEKHGITDENIKTDFVDKLFEARVVGEMSPEIKVNIPQLKVVQRGGRGCLIFDGRYHYILPYMGNVFGCTQDKEIAKENFQKFEHDEEI